MTKICLFVWPDLIAAINDPENVEGLEKALATAQALKHNDRLNGEINQVLKILKVSIYSF